jgi:hypothetical protein
MPNLTTNLGLKKPLSTEFYDINVMNENLDTIDTNITQNKNDIQNINYDIALMPTLANANSFTNVNTFKEGINIGDPANVAWKGMAFNRLIGVSVFASQFGISNLDGVQGTVGYGITKDGVSQGSILFNPSSLFPSSNNTVDVGKTDSVFKDLWIGTRSIGTSGYSKLPNGLILQWGAKSITAGSAYYQQADFTFPIAFPTACIHCSADNGRNSNAWYDLITSAVAVDKSTVRIMVRHVTGGILNSNFSCTYFAIGY